jgi:hypothetical protein
MTERSDTESRQEQRRLIAESIRSNLWDRFGLFPNVTPGELNHFGNRALRSLPSLSVVGHRDNRLVRATRFIGEFSDRPVQFDPMDAPLIRRIAESQQLILDRYMATRLATGDPAAEDQSA